MSRTEETFLSTLLTEMMQIEMAAANIRGRSPVA
jgi:hypothetical protein